MEAAARGTEGITLAQLAGVRAGVMSGFPLAAVLANERVDPRVWPLGEEAWEEEIDRDSDEGWTLDETYDALLAAALHRYARRLPPLEDELRAWLDFVRIWSEVPDPAAMLDELGLRPTDLTHLHQVWSRRMAEEPTLQRASIAILANAPASLPIPRPEPAVMEPPPAALPADLRLPRPGWSPADPDVDDEDDEPESGPRAIPSEIFAALPSDTKIEEPAPMPAAVPVAPENDVVRATREGHSTPPVSFVEYASMVAELEVVPEQRGWILAKYRVSDEATLRQVETYWNERFTESAEDRDDWERARARLVKHWKTVHQR